MSKKIFIKTFGCQMNEYDSNRIFDTVKKIGYNRTNIYEEANCYVLNTCHIRDKAKEKVYHEIGRVKKIFRSKNKPLVIVAGCVAQAENQEMLKREPYIDLVIGPQSYHEINNKILNFTKKKEKSETIEFEADDKFDYLSKIKNEMSEVSSFLTVQEGCDKFCHFCVVPYTRGSEYSRTVKEISDEVKSLIDQGVVEFTLLGQNVNAYHGLDNQGQSNNLASLINSISLIDGVERITYSTSHPVNMTDDLISLHGENSKLMPYLHLPVQSGSDKVLKLMNRKHTRDYYFEIIEKVRKVKPDIALSSDFIIGFPGETDKDFVDTIDLIERVKYMNSYSFKYSPRPGTPAADREEIDEEILNERLKITQDLLNEQQIKYNNQFVKKTVQVLINGAGNRSGQIKGKSQFNQSVALQGEKETIGQIIPVQIKEVLTHSLLGEKI